MEKIKILKKENCYTGFNSVNKYVFEFESFDKKNILTCEREILERKDSIAVVLYDNNKDKLLLIQQFRSGCYIKKNIKYPFEIVAGLIDKNDTIENTVIREVKEESGVEISKLLKICSFFPEINFSTREMHLFCGKFDSTKIKNYAGLKEENEDIKILLFSKEEVKNMLKNNEIINSHSLIALQWFFLNSNYIENEFEDLKN
ncbi:MAG: NUDIX domain-containing protein [Rickettsiales bacterium]|nr:NUDIX domain-containing protein [Rickettsiales bacterium]